MKIAIDEDKKRKVIVENVRKELISAIEGVENIVKLDNFTTDELNEILFDYLCFSRNIRGKEFALPVEILRKLDMSNVSFDDFNANKVDFSGMTGVRIDPNKLCGTNIRECNFSGVTFLDKFSMGHIDDCNFTGSKNAIILDTIDLGRRNNFGDVTFEGTITNGDIVGSDFSGSKGAVIEIGPEKITSVANCRLKDATLKGTFFGCYIAGADFTGAHTKNGGRIRINPNELATSSSNGTYVYDFISRREGVEFVKNVSGCKFDGVEFTDSFGTANDFVITGADFSGSEGAFIYPHSIFKNDYHGAKLNGVEFFPKDAIINAANLEGTSFKGSKGAVISGLQETVADADLTDAAVKFNNQEEMLQMTGVESAKYDDREFTSVFKESISREFEEPTKRLIKKVKEAVTASDN